MGRTVKHLLYGFLYLSLAALFAMPFWYPLIFPAPTCTDGILNQSEEQIDCGGECAPCGLDVARLEVGGAKVIEVGDRTTIVLEVSNASDKFGLERVEYKVEILGRIGQGLRTLEGEFSILPGESKQIVEAAIDLLRAEVGEVIFTLGETDFVLEEELPQFDLDIDSVETTFPDEEVYVSGVLINNESFTLKEIKLATVLYDETGNVANAGTTIVSDIPAFGSREFLFRLPRTELFVDSESTVVSIVLVSRR